MKKIKNSIGAVAGICLVLTFYACAASETFIPPLIFLAIAIVLMVISSRTPDA